MRQRTRKHFATRMDEKLIIERYFEVRSDMMLDTKERYKVTLDE